MPNLNLYFSKTDFIGGAGTALDSIDGADLTGGEYAFVCVSDVFYVYKLDAASGAAESSPDIISPDANPGTKRWILQPHRSASTTVAGKVEIATAAETTTGTDAARAVSPDGLAGSDYGKRIMIVKTFDDITIVTTGDGKMIFPIPVELNGWNLVDADGFCTTVSSSGTPTIQIRNVTQAADMLTTAITIDAGEYTSYTAATPPVIDAANDDVATGDLIAVDVDVAGTGTKGLGVILSFQLP